VLTAVARCRSPFVLKAIGTDAGADPRLVLRQ
jgi:hypothetical protein